LIKFDHIWSFIFYSQRSIVFIVFHVIQGVSIDLIVAFENVKQVDLTGVVI